MTSRTDARTAFAEVLLDRIRRDRYPSYSEMAVFEQTAPPEMTDAYMQVLIEKCASQRPSITMLRHVSRLALQNY
jgi:hypothetical protein